DRRMRIVGLEAEHVTAGHPPPTELPGVPVVLDLEHVPRDIRRMPREELLDVVPIDRHPPVEPILPTDRRKPPKAPKPHEPHRRRPRHALEPRAKPTPRSLGQRALRDPPHAGI